MIKRVQQRAKKDTGDPPTPLYQTIATMKEFNLSPREWRDMSSFDRKALYYFRIAQQDYMDSALEAQKKPMDQEHRQQEAMSRMPKQLRGGRR